MTGINKAIGAAVYRIYTNFADDLGNIRSGFGTGFWLLLDDKRPVFVTNKHNVDPSINFPGGSLRLTAVSVDLRSLVDQAKIMKVELVDRNCIHCSPTADCAILLNPRLNIPSDGMNYTVPFYVLRNDLADQKFFEDHVQMMDAASFIGFAGNPGEEWWDQEISFPIARSATVSSLPHKSFVNKSIRTSDVTLVSGFSFQGSSGSPVFLHQKGIRTGPGLAGHHVPPKVIGIMSGHFREAGKEAAMFQHTGLSYYTRSTSILELIDKFQSPAGNAEKGVCL